jgi:hypothetical protein
VGGGEGSWSGAGPHSGNAAPGQHYEGGQGNRGCVAVTELAARIRAVLRRRSQSARAQLQVEDLVMDRLSPSVHRSGHAIDLSPKEFSLLEFLMRHSGHPVSHWLSNRGERPGRLTTTCLGTSKRQNRGLWLVLRKSAPDTAIGALPTVSYVAF